MVIVCPDGKVSYYMDKRLIKILDKAKRRVQTKDKDILICVDGEEGEGKSVFAMQIAKYLDPTYCLDDVYMDAESFNKGIRTEGRKHKVKHFDEAHKGTTSRATLSKLNRAVNSNLMQMRQLNLYCILCIPTFFLLDKYISLFRARYLFHVFESKSGDHKWRFYNRKKKKKLYLLGKKMLSYSYPRITKNRGIFRGKYTIDEEAYRRKKKKALEMPEELEVDNKYLLQRDVILATYVKKTKLTYSKVEEELKAAGLVNELHLSRSRICEICVKHRKKQ